MPADAANAISTATRRYRSPLTFVRFPYDENRQVVYCPLTGKQTIVSKAALRWLGRCQTFATIEEHAAKLGEELSMEPTQLDATRDSLNQLAAAEILLSDENFVDKYIGRIRNEDSPPLISSLAVPTRNRPQLLQRCLESYSHCKTDERDFRFVIADQSDDAQTQKTNLQLLESLKKSTGISSTYIGWKEKKEFARRLADYSGIAQETIDFCLHNDDERLQGYGANRNALLLSTIDEMTLQVDDDTVCMVAPRTESTPGIVLTTQYDPTDIIFLSEQETKDLCCEFTFNNVFALHEELLGRSISSCIDRHSGIYNVNSCDSSFFRRLEPRKVAVTFLGTGGELAAGTSFSSMVMGEKATTSLVRSESDYRFAMINQQAKRAVSGPTITSGKWCCTLNIGLDNRQLLPLFMPVQKNEDGIFAATHKATGQGYFGFLPWMLLHDRPSRLSNYSDVLHDLRKSSAGISSGKVLVDMVRAEIPNPDRRDAKANLTALGESLTDLGSRPLSEFRQAMHLTMLKECCRRISLLEGQLKMYKEAPQYWAANLSTSLSVLRESLPAASYMVPTDLLAIFGEEDALILFQRLVLKFGELLKVCAHVRQSTRELKERGVYLGLRI